MLSFFLKVSYTNPHDDFAFSVSKNKFPHIIVYSSLILTAKTK